MVAKPRHVGVVKRIVGSLGSGRHYEGLSEISLI
jgi:hypothetical protein